MPRGALGLIIPMELPWVWTEGHSSLAEQYFFPMTVCDWAARMVLCLGDSYWDKWITGSGLPNVTTDPWDWEVCVCVCAHAWGLTCFNWCCLWSVDHRLVRLVAVVLYLVHLLPLALGRSPYPFAGSALCARPGPSHPKPFKTVAPQCQSSLLISVLSCFSW